MTHLSRWRDSLLTGIAYYYGTSLIVLLGICLGDDFVRRPPHSYSGTDVISRMANGNGYFYRKAADDGYWYQPGTQCTVPFFPAYPLLGRSLNWATQIGTGWSLLLVAHACLVAAFVLLARYLNQRFPEASREHLDYVLLSFGLLPITMFLRMVHSEAMFVCVTILALYAIQQRWPVVVVALIVGVATATRPVGVALVPMLGLYAWRRFSARDALREKDGPSSPTTRMPFLFWARLLRVGAFTALSCWGLATFMVYQWQAFGEPLAFAKSQVDWRLRIGADVSWHRKALAELTLEPIWEAYLPSRENYWARHDAHGNPFFSAHCAEPIYFVGTVALVLVGWRKRWLNQYELLLSAGLLLIPYVTKSYDNAMASFGRFSAVVVPAYLVMGHLLARLSSPVAAVILAVSAFFLGVYAALFAVGYTFI